MIVNQNGKKVICTKFNNQILTLQDSDDWSVWLKDVQDVKDSTVRVFMKSMERFWIWCLYNPIKLRETFPSYQARYRKALRKGYEITIMQKDERFEEPVEISVCFAPPMEKVTVNKEISGINSYFYFADESALIEDHRFINYLHEKHKSSKGFLAGVQIKKSKSALAAFGKKKKYLTPYKTPKNRKPVKYFPLALYDDLLAIAKPRERLVFLLCGATSARIGQALNLTLYDIDYEKKEVWLIDPKSDNVDIHGNKRRIWLQEEYGIDVEGENEHNTLDLQFKSPIPYYFEPLTWLDEDKYKNLFFQTLTEFMRSEEYISESARFNRHPFMFTSKTGKRLHARETYGRFINHTRKVLRKKKQTLDLDGMGLHSLRHMFGHALAELSTQTGDDSLFYICQMAMGHAGADTTRIYFNISRKTVRKILKDAQKKQEEQEDHDKIPWL